MGKRGAAQSSASRAPKAAKVVDPKLADYRNITKGLKMDPDLPYNAQEMLTEMMPSCLGEVKENRHASQISMIGIYEASLSNVEAGMKQGIAEVEGQIAGLGGEKSKREAAVAEAEANMAAKDKDAEGKKHALADVAGTFQAAKSALAAAQHEQTVGDKEARLAGSRLAELQAALAEMVEPLSAGTLPAEEIAKTISSLVQALTVFDFDKSLLTSIPNAMSKAPAERGQFDVVVVENIKTETVKRITSFSEIVQNEEPAKRARAAKVESAERELAAAREKQNTSADAFTSARDARKESLENLELKRLELTNLDEDSAKLHRKADTLRNKLTTFQENQLGSLRRLVGLTAESAEPTGSSA